MVSSSLYHFPLSSLLSLSLSLSLSHTTFTILFSLPSTYAPPKIVFHCVGGLLKKVKREEFLLLIIMTLFARSLRAWYYIFIVTSSFHSFKRLETRERNQYLLDFDITWFTESFKRKCYWIENLNILYMYCIIIWSQKYVFLTLI